MSDLVRSEVEAWLEPFGDVPPDFTVEQVEEIRHGQEEE